MLFDIDGTLVLTGGAGLRAMNRACEHLVGHQNALDGVTLAGRTDWIILDDALARNGLALNPDLLDDLRRKYVEHLREEIGLPGKGVKAVMPGIRPLLDALQGNGDVALGLLTGNFVEGARIKLEYFDLWKFFRCGAYGDDASDRNQLVPVAIERARRVRIDRCRADRRRGDWRHAARHRVRQGRRLDADRSGHRQLFRGSVEGGRGGCGFHGSERHGGSDAGAGKEGRMIGVDVTTRGSSRLVGLLAVALAGPQDS